MMKELLMKIVLTKLLEFIVDDTPEFILVTIQAQCDDGEQTLMILHLSLIY